MFQTIPDFLKAPFGEPEIKSNELERKYKDLIQHKRIALSGYCMIDDNHLVHLKIGSDTNVKESYDVVLLFFTDDEILKKNRSFRSFYVKFFSNSPSFIYQYAALYKKNGFLIDLFYEKMDKEFSDTLPKNVSKLSYDKSIYAACRYMEDHIANAYSVTYNKLHQLSPEKFIRGIRDFNDIKMTSELRQIDRKINAELKRNKEEKKKKNTDKSTTRNASSKSTGIQKSKVITAKSSTLSRVTPSKRAQKKRTTKRTKTF